MAVPNSDQAFFKTRGVVLVPEDLTLADWPQRAKRAGLTTIGLHHQHSPAAVMECVRGERGQAFLAGCREAGVEVEYELHAMRELLPRGLFAKDPGLFRMNEKGERVADHNLCVHSARAMEIVAGSAVRIAETLRPTTGRYFYWGDDGKPWCQCPSCRGLSESDQSMILDNHLAKALRTFDPRATLAHLSYANTLWPPAQVKPRPEVFLEFAPMSRRFDIPFETPEDPKQRESLDALDANLEVFDPAAAQAMEYWLAVSLFSLWARPAKKLPWNADVFRADVEAYGRRGLRHVTSFADFIDAEYVRLHGDPPLDEYGRTLLEWRPRGR